MKSTRWSFTWNNYTAEDCALLDSLHEAGKVRYLVYQREVGEQGTPHLQGFVQLKQSRLAAMVSLFGGSGHAHFSIARGTPEQNRHYCLKPHPGCDCKHCVQARKCPPPTEPREFGTAITQGARSDILELRDAIFAGKRPREVIEDDDLCVAFAKYPRYAERLNQFAPSPALDVEPETVLLLGPTGCGKTRSVREGEDDMWIRPVGQGFWFDGYADHPAVFFDEFEGKRSKWTLSDFLQVTDRLAISPSISSQISPYCARQRWTC